jgi:hypothetical protein
MQTIDVHDLPEPVARAIEETVRSLRHQLKKNGNGEEVRLPTWPLGVVGKLTREQIYDDYLKRSGDADPS